MSQAPPEQLEDQFERTQLAWRRTALSLVAAGLLVGHLSSDQVGAPGFAAVLLGIAAVVGFVWVRTGTQVGAAALAMALGVVLLGLMALVGVAGGVPFVH